MTMCKPSPGFNNDNAGNDENDPVLTSNQNNNTGTANNAEDSEREVWEFMTPKVWHESVAAKDSIFRPTYQATIDTLRKTAEEGGYDVILEVGCGTGDIIGEMNTQQVCRRSSLLNLKGLLISPDDLVTGAAEDAENFVTIPCIGVDINKEFVDFCKTTHPHPSCEFVVADALKLHDWWQEQGYATKYKKPLLICVNNTLNIMPHELRGSVIDQMIAVAGKEGLCMVSYWNGNFFSHAVMNYYKKNAPLCGSFDVFEHVDWDARMLITPTNYSTHWQTPLEVQSLLRSYDVDVPDMVEAQDLSRTGSAHIRCDKLAIFVWFDRNSTSNAKGYYDSDDAQTFYNKIWANEDYEGLFHVGRYDLLTDAERATLTLQQQIRRAEELHELELVQHIRQHLQLDRIADDTLKGTLRVVDLGCGYGGLLRRLYKEGLIWKGTGIDFSHKMCKEARERNTALLLNTTIPATTAATATTSTNTLEILEESYLQLSVGDESVDVVISMDSLLHVGPERQRSVIREVYRMLRPGGWIIFSDIMQNDVVNEDEMQPIYDRINLSKMGTISTYKAALTDTGFTNFSTEIHSSNIAVHYGNVLEVTRRKGNEIGLSPAYIKKAVDGLKVWTEHSPGNIVWATMAAQKTHKVVV